MNTARKGGFPIRPQLMCRRHRLSLSGFPGVETLMCKPNNKVGARHRFIRQGMVGTDAG